MLSTIIISIPPSFGGKLESFLVTGEYLKASCDNNDQNSNELIVEMNTSKRIQINCGTFNTTEDAKNIDLQNGDSVKIICITPDKHGE
jgi:hypothetical protein